MGSVSELRIVILGKSQNEQSTLRNLLTRKKHCSYERHFNRSASIQDLREKPPTVAKTVDLFSRSQDGVRHQMMKCVAECLPGPNVLLLLVKPSDFTEKDRHIFNFIMSLFGEDAFKYLMIVTTENDRGDNSSVNQIMEDYRHRKHRINLGEKDLPDSDLHELITEMLNIVSENRGQHLNFTEETDPMVTPACSKHSKVTRHASFLKPNDYTDQSKEFYRKITQRQSLRGGPRSDPPRIVPRSDPPRTVPRSDPPRTVPRSDPPRTVPRSDPPRTVPRSDPPRTVPRSDPPRTVTSMESFRMVLIGKTGCGKSATGNTILGKDCFNSKVCPNSVTQLCQKETVEIDGRSLVVVDTPGLFDTTLSSNQVQQELVKCISMLAPGPHVFLLVVQIGRFTKEEEDTVEHIKTFFGKKSEDFIILIFTRGDELSNQTIQSYIEADRKGIIKTLVTQCGGRYSVFNNKNRSDCSQVSQLLTKVESLVRKNGNGCYTSEMFREAEVAIQKEMEKIMKEKEPEIQREQIYLERNHRKEMEEKKKEKMAELKHKFDHDERAKIIKDNEEHIKREEEKGMKERQKREEEDRNKRKQEELQQLLWEQKHENLEKKLKCGTAKKAVSDGILMRNRAQIQKEREAWEQERHEWWEKRYREDEERREREQTRLRKLREEYEQELEMYENKRKEDVRIRKENEEREFKEAQEIYNKKLEEIRRKHEEEARKQAEECNNFRQRYISDIPADQHKYKRETETLKQRQWHRQQNEMIIGKLCKNKVFQKDLDKLKKKQKEEINELKLTYSDNTDTLNEEIDELKKIHDEEINQWIHEHVQKAVEKNTCRIL